jgi:hypothetical protein
MSVKVQLEGRVRVKCQLSQACALSLSHEPHDDVPIILSVRPTSVPKSRPHPECSLFSCTSPGFIPKTQHSKDGNAICRLVQRRPVQRSYPEAERRSRSESTQTRHLHAERVLQQAVRSYQFLQGEPLSLSSRCSSANADMVSHRRPNRV